MVPAKEPGWHGAQVRLFAMEEKVPTWQGEQMVPLMKLPGWQVVLDVCAGRLSDVRLIDRRAFPLKAPLCPCDNEIARSVTIQ